MSIKTTILLSMVLLKTLVVNNSGTRFIIFLFWNPHRLGGGQWCQDRSSNPCSIFMLRRSNNLSFFSWVKPEQRFPSHSLVYFCKHRSPLPALCSSRKIRGREGGRGYPSKELVFWPRRVTILLPNWEGSGRMGHLPVVWLRCKPNGHYHR